MTASGGAGRPSGGSSGGGGDAYEAGLLALFVLPSVAIALVTGRPWMAVCWSAGALVGLALHEMTRRR